MWVWTAVERASQEIKGFFVGSRETSSFEKLSKDIENIDVDCYASDGLEAYNLIDPRKHLIGKKHTYTVERGNRLTRHYLARFTRKTYSVSQKKYMVANSLYVWVFQHLFPRLVLCFLSFVRYPIFLFLVTFFELSFCSSISGKSSPAKV